MEDLESQFVNILPKEEDNYALIFNDKSYNGWFRYVINSEEYTDIIVRFRLPKTLHLYGDIARSFTNEEILVGIHRMLVGKDLQEEIKDLLKYNSINEYVASMDDTSVSSLLNRMKSIVTLDCNKVPYLHIRIAKNTGISESDYEKTIKEHIGSFPNFIKIFYEVLNEKITIIEASLKSSGVIFNEYDTLKK